jgi:hypothetical protein
MGSLIDRLVTGAPDGAADSRTERADGPNGRTLNQ